VFNMWLYGLFLATLMQITVSESVVINYSAHNVNNKHSSGSSSSGISRSSSDNISNGSNMTCPDSTDIAPCVCYIDPEDQTLNMDCSKVTSNEELAKVFTAEFPYTDFKQLYAYGAWNLTVLGEGVFGPVTFSEIYIHMSGVRVIEEGALMGSMETLKSLDIHDCYLETFPFHILPDLTAMIHLDLFTNLLQLNTLPQLESTTLKYLHLGENQITSVPVDAFQLLPAIEFIGLGNWWWSYVRLTEIQPGTFLNLKHLNEIELLDEQISHIRAGTFVTGSGSLKKVWLGSSHVLHTVDVDAFEPVENMYISLGNNNLTDLPEEVWRPLLEVNSTLNIWGNPFSCDCSLAWLIREPDFVRCTSYGVCSDGTHFEDLDPDMYDNCI
ncbi:unnamed protein product, partial [Meganyctiphanes norvegica]